MPEYLDTARMKAIAFIELLCTPSEMDFTGQASEAKQLAFLMAVGVFFGLFVLWALYCHISLYVFNTPTRWHKPEAVQRLGLTMPRRGTATPVLDLLGLCVASICEGVVLIGQTGCGKSSTIYRLMKEVLQLKNNGIYAAGCLWLTAKPSEVMAALKVIDKAGRVPKVLIPGTAHCNLMTYELTRPGGSPDSFAALIEKVNEVINGASTGKEEGFWKGIRITACTLATAAVWIAYRKEATFECLFDFLTTAPHSLQQVSTDTFESSYCNQTLELAAKRCRTPAEERLITEANEFFTKSLPGSGEKVIGATVSYLAAMIAPFLRGDWYDTVNCIDSDFSPEDPCRGECLVMGEAVVMNPAAHMFQVLFQLMASEAAIRRQVQPESPVVVIVQDEMQLCSHLKSDALNQTIARSQKLAKVVAFQNLSVMHAASAEPIRAKHEVASLIGNLNTKVFLAQQDKDTMELFEHLCGKQFRMLTGGGQHPQQQQHDSLGVSADMHMNFHQQLMPRKLGTALTNLRTGGPHHDFVIDAYVIAPGRRFDGQTFKKISIEQEVD